MQSMPIAEKRPDRLTLAAFVALVVFAGSNAVAIRFSNAELPPFWGATVRFAAASLLFFSTVLVRRLPLPRGRALAGSLLYGLFNFAAFYALGYWALVQVQAGLATVVFALGPLMTFFLAFAHGQEPFRWRPLAGALLALAGIAVVFGDQLGAAVPLAPLLAIVAAVACAAEASVIVKAFPASHPVTTNAVAMAVGAALLFGLSLVAGEQWAIPRLPNTWAVLGYLVVIGSVVLFALFMFVIKRWTASATSYVFVLMPFVTVPLGAWLAHEAVSAAFLLGGVIVLSGVFVGATGQPAAKPSKVPVLREVVPPACP